MTQHEIYKFIQDCLKNTPKIIWGSGATMQYGLPSMSDLNKDIKKQFPNFNQNNENLEKELNDEKYENDLPKIREIIWNCIYDADYKVVENLAYNRTEQYKVIDDLLNIFYSSTPQRIDIITTNYDRVLENVLSFYNYNFTDGFNGKLFSKFDKNLFKDKQIVNIIKVHGSLNWQTIDSTPRFLPTIIKNMNPKIIIPGKNKYRETHELPYRDLIAKSDQFIEEAECFLVIGFGFNDEHLTPKIEEKIKNDTPIVLITKSITHSTNEKIKNAKRYVLIEENEQGSSKIRYKKDSKVEKTVILKGNLWTLKEFIEII